MTTTHTPTMHDHAMSYAKRGYHIFPVWWINDFGTCGCGNRNCKDPGKHPIPYRGVWDATTDSTQIAAWWAKHPRANIGWHPGPSGHLAMDLDKYKDEFDATATGAIITKADEETLTSLTGGGGNHLGYATPAGEKFGSNRSGLPKGIDIRCWGGYIILPPSNHKSGNRYQWETGYSPDEMTPAPLPQKLYDILKAAQQTAQAAKVTIKANLPEPDVEQWRLPGWLIEDLDIGHLDNDRSANDWRVMCALAERGLSNDDITAVWQHYPIGTDGKYADDGDRYLSMTLGKVRAKVGYPVGQYNGYQNGVKVSGNLGGVDDMVIQPNGTQQTGAELIADIQTAVKNIDPDTGEILDSGTASIPFTIVNKNRSMLRGYGYTDEQINAMKPTDALAILNSKRDDNAPVEVDDHVSISDVQRFGSPKYSIGQKVNYFSLDAGDNSVDIYDAGEITAIHCGPKGWEYTTNRGGVLTQTMIKPLVESTSYTMEIPPKYQKSVEPIPLPDIAAAPELPDWAKLSSDELTEAAHTGKFLRQYIEFAKDASPMTPIQFNVSAGLAAVAIAIARRVHVRVGASKIYPNLYQIYVGPSTLQRKTTGMNTLTNLMNLAGMIPIFTLAETQTPEAFVEDMTLNLPSTYDRMSPTARAVWLDRRRLYAQRGWIIDEASRLLDSFNRDYTSGLLPIVLDLYDSKDRSGERNTKSWGNESVEKAYLNIFGATTFSSIGKHVADPERWGDGFFARFSFTASNEPGAWQFWPEPMDYPQSLVDELYRIAFRIFGAPPLTSTVTNENKDEDGKSLGRPTISIEIEQLKDNSARFGVGAFEMWERYSKATGYDMLLQAAKDNSIPVEMFPSYGRLGTMLVKVAMLFAVMDAQTSQIIIEKKHVAAAQRVVEMWRESLHIVKAGGQVTAAKTFVDKVLATLSKNGENWTIRRDLQHALGCSWAELEPAIDDLHGAGLVERTPYAAKRGPKSEMYRAVVNE